MQRADRAGCGEEGSCIEERHARSYKREIRVPLFIYVCTHAYIYIERLTTICVYIYTHTYMYIYIYVYM